MNYRKHRGLRISEVGVGTYSLSGVYGSKNVEEFKSMICRAAELGVTFFDTAEAYGKAEEILGEAVEAFREEILIATKVGVREGIKPNLSREYIEKACERSLERLQTEYIDLYQVHFNDPTTPVEETIRALDELVDEGKIRYYGVGHIAEEVIEEYCKTGNPLSVLMELSAVARESHSNLLPLCERCDLGIIAFSTSGRGLLTGRFLENQKFEAEDIRSMDPLFQRERFQYGLRIGRRLAELGKRHGKTSTQVAIAWVLAQPGVICALTGPSTISHLEENLAASGWTIPKGDLEELETFMKKEDDWLQREQRVSIRDILSNPLGAPQKAFTDLIYAIETSVSLHLITEKEVLPVFYELYEMKKELGKKGIELKLRRLQIHLRELIPFEE